MTTQTPVTLTLVPWMVTRSWRVYGNGKHKKDYAYVTHQVNLNPLTTGPSTLGAVSEWRCMAGIHGDGAQDDCEHIRLVRDGV